MKWIAALSAAPERPLDAPYIYCVADASDALHAAHAGSEAKPQRYTGLLLAWPRDAEQRDADEALVAPQRTASWRVQEIVHWDELREPDADAVLLAYFVRRRAGLTRQQFETHYREHHAPLAREHHPGIARYVQNFVEEASIGSHAVDAVAELWFADEQSARTRFYRDEESRRVIAEDVRRFVSLRGGFALVARPAAVAAA